MKNLVFKEKQKFTQWWLWLLVAIIAALVILPIYKAFSEGKDFDAGQWFGLIVVVSVTVMLFTVRLDTYMDEEGIRVKFIPFIFKTKFISWSEIETVHIRKYKPLREYGGWGWRVGPNGKAYNVKGNQGLQLLFKDRTALLIGTQKPRELEMFLKQIGKA